MKQVHNVLRHHNGLQSPLDLVQGSLHLSLMATQHGRDPLAHQADHKGMETSLQHLQGDRETKENQQRRQWNSSGSPCEPMQIRTPHCMAHSRKNHCTEQERTCLLKEFHNDVLVLQFLQLFGNRTALTQREHVQQAASVPPLC